MQDCYGTLTNPGSTFGFIIIHLLLFMDDQTPILRHLEVMAHSSGSLGAWLGGCSERWVRSWGRTHPWGQGITLAPAPSIPPQSHPKLHLTQHPLRHVGVQKVEGLILFPFLQPGLALLPSLLPPLLAPLPFFLFLLLIL